MGIFWEIVQTGVILKQACKARSNRKRIKKLEERLEVTENRLKKVVKGLTEIQEVEMEESKQP